VREWLVIESSWKQAVFADDGTGKDHEGFIPRDSAERLLGRNLVEPDGRVTWFTKEEGEKMRTHPEWRKTLPEWSPLGFWSCGYGP
jgi:hypothetical protein